MLRLLFKRTKPVSLGRWNYSHAERKIDLANIYNEADKFVRKIVIPSNKEPKNNLMRKPSDLKNIETLASRG